MDKALEDKLLDDKVDASHGGTYIVIGEPEKELFVLSISNWCFAKGNSILPKVTSPLVIIFLESILRQKHPH